MIKGGRVHAIMRQCHLCQQRDRWWPVAVPGEERLILLGGIWKPVVWGRGGFALFQ